VETLYWSVSKKGKPISVNKPIVFCEKHRIHDFQENLVSDRIEQINELFNHNNGVIKPLISDFRIFVHTILFNYQETTKKLFESIKNNSPDKNNILEERIKLKLYYGYSLIRLYELEDEKYIFFERGQDELKPMNNSDYTFFRGLMEGELMLLFSNKLDLLSFFDYGEKNKKLAIIFKSDKKTLKKILRWGYRNENRSFFNSTNNLESDFLFYDRDQSPRHFSLERMEGLWNLFTVVYKEFFGIDCLFENPSEFKLAIEIFRFFHTDIFPFGKENPNPIVNNFVNKSNVSQKQLKKFIDSFLPICYDLGKSIPIKKYKRFNDLESIIYNIASCCKFNNKRFLIPQPFDWLERRIGDIGPLFLRKIETLPSKMSLDLFCDEIELLVNGILTGKLSITPTTLHKEIRIQKKSFSLKIIAKNVHFTLDNGEDGEIDIIIQNMGTLYLLEAKSLRKGRANRKYIREKSPRQCDRYVDLVKEGYLESLLSKYRVDYNQVKDVRILVVTSRYPDFHFVQSKDTQYVFGVISVVNFLRLYIGFRSDVESTFVDDLGKEIVINLHNTDKDAFIIHTSNLQTKYRINAYKKQIDSIYTHNWLNTKNYPNLKPLFTFPEEINDKNESDEEMMSFLPFSKKTGNFLFGIFNQIVLEGSFKNELNWVLKTPKKITDQPIKVYLATQIGNTHFKTWCEPCEICYVYYEDDKQEKHELEKRCFFCEEKLVFFPSVLKKKYSTELNQRILFYKMQIQSKMFQGHVNYE